MARCSKVMTTISTGRGVSKLVTAILDTGAGPNLIREDVLSTAWLKKIQPIRSNLRAASDTTFTVEGIVRLTIEIGGHVSSTVFGVAPKLATKMILGMAFVNNEISRMETRTDELYQGVITQSQSSRVMKTKTPYSL